MAQCFTNPTLTLFGTTVFPGEAGSPTYSTWTHYVTVEGTPIPYETSTCIGGYKGGYTDACSYYSTYTTYSTGLPTTSTLYDVVTIAPEAGSSITSTFPTETRYTTSCTTTPDSGTTTATPTTPQPAITPTPPPSVATPSTVVSVGVSSNPVTITNSNGVVSVSVQIQSVSVLFTSNVAAAATGISALNANNSSSPSIGPIVGGVVGGLAFLGTIFALVFFLRRKNKNSRDDDDYTYDDGYGTVRRNSDRGDKVERKRMDLAEEDPNPGFVQPFTYTDSSTPQNQHHTYPSQGPNSFSSYSPVPTSSSPPPHNDFGHNNPSFAAAGATYSQSQPQPRSPPSSSTMTSAQAKSLEAQQGRSRSAGGGSSSGRAFGAGSEEEEEVVVHEDAGPANNRVDLPPVYVDRS